MSDIKSCNKLLKRKNNFKIFENRIKGFKVGNYPIKSNEIGVVFSELADAVEYCETDEVENTKQVLTISDEYLISKPILMKVVKGKGIYNTVYNCIKVVAPDGTSLIFHNKNEALGYCIEHEEYKQKQKRNEMGINGVFYRKIKKKLFYLNMSTKELENEFYEVYKEKVTKKKDLVLLNYFSCVLLYNYLLDRIKELGKEREIKDDSLVYKIEKAKVREWVKQYEGNKFKESIFELLLSSGIIEEEKDNYIFSLKREEITDEIRQIIKF